MEPENLALDLGTHAAAALTVLTMARRDLRAPDDLPAARAGATQRTSGQLRSDMKQRWLPTAASTSAT